MIHSCLPQLTFSDSISNSVEDRSKVALLKAFGNPTSLVVIIMDVQRLKLQFDIKQFPGSCPAKNQFVWTKGPDKITAKTAISLSVRLHLTSIMS